jgi:hypothetical protein
VTVHRIVSPSHGELRCVTSEHEPDDRGRTWTAVLDPRRQRLGHLLAAKGASEAEALSLMAVAVERYDARGLVRRASAHH